MNDEVAVIVNEAQFAELVHEQQRAIWSCRSEIIILIKVEKKAHVVPSRAEVRLVP